jgi:hypothetical protein
MTLSSLVLPFDLSTAASTAPSWGVVGSLMDKPVPKCIRLLQLPIVIYVPGFRNSYGVRICVTEKSATAMTSYYSDSEVSFTHDQQP